MITNGKYYIAPPGGELDLKELFQQLVAAGAGRRVDKDGFPSGPWTPELLAKAISQVDGNTDGIELRSVQLWFQDNVKGISTDNRRWLARIFGCDDPEATSLWQMELSAAQTRLAAKRRLQRQAQSLDPQPSDQGQTPSPMASDVDPNPVDAKSNLARRSEALFSRRSPLDLPILVFAGVATLGFLSYIFGVHNVTYSPIEGLSKQVGFLWAPSWTLEGLILLPLFLIVVSGLLSYWKDERLLSPALGNAGIHNNHGWMAKVDSFSIAFWVILMACLLIVCALQWTATYLSAFRQGATQNAMVDWILVAVVRPDVISIPEAFALSILAFLYSGLIYWFYLVGLLLLFMVSNDFYETYYSPELPPNDTCKLKALEIGTEMMRSVFRCTVFGIMIAMCIKLNTAYLLSDGTNIVSWLLNDALSLMGFRDVDAGWLNASALPYFTSVLLVMLTSFVFFASFAQISWVLDQPATSDPSPELIDHQEIENLIRRTKISWYKMISIVGLLIISFLLIGQVLGFSLLLCASVLIATYSLFQRTHDAKDRQLNLSETK